MNYPALAPHFGLLMRVMLCRINSYIDGHFGRQAMQTCADSSFAGDVQNPYQRPNARTAP
jgi:hypothetical protein